MTRRILSLMLLLTQAAMTFAGPAFTLCISPNGRVCIDAPWTTCTCCQEDGIVDQVGQAQGVVDGNDKSVCESVKRCSCCFGLDNAPPPEAIQTRPADAGAVIAHGQPCRCKHLPLILAQDDQHPAAERTSVADRHSIDLFVTAPVASPFGWFSPTRHAVPLLPQPPPSDHLLVLSCTVLRC